MIHTIYIERDVLSHPRAQRLLQRYTGAHVVEIERFGEVFNRRAQNFRLQKTQPALILARKFDHFVLPTPEGYGIGGEANFYFSHMLNCVYDCRYCFLQGQFSSAHYLLFVNYEEFLEALGELSRQHARPYFFSGYDCDSLAFEAMTGFTDVFVPWFSRHPNAFLELRTKSVQIRALLQRAPLDNVVVAWSLTPEALADSHEHGAPSLRQRLAAMRRLANAGWNIGLRFDPLLYVPDYQQQYGRLFEQTFEALPRQRIHSVSLGALRFPKSVFERIYKLYPDEPLLAPPMEQRQGLVSYPTVWQEDLMEFARTRLEEYVPASRLFAPAMSQETS